MSPVFKRVYTLAGESWTPGMLHRILSHSYTKTILFCYRLSACMILTKQTWGILKCKIEKLRLHSIQLEIAGFSATSIIYDIDISK